MYITYAGRLLARKLPLIVVSALVGLALAAAAFITMMSYSTSTFMMILPSNSMASIRAVSPERFFETETQLILSDTLLANACESLNDGTTPQTLRRAVTLSGGSQSDVVELIVSGKTPKQSLNRMRAVLRGLADTRLQSIEVTTLWTAAPQSTMSRLQILAGGLLGGALLGALMILIWGTVARPILDPRCVALGLDVDVYPQTVEVSGAEWPLQRREVLSWLSTYGSPGKPKHVFVADLTKTTGSQALLRALQDATINTSAVTFTDANDYVTDADLLSPEASGAQRVVLYVGAVNQTREAEVEDRARMLRGVANQSLLVLTARSKGSSLPSQHGTARRGTDS